MARRTVSMSADHCERFAVRCEADQIPKAQAIEQLIDLWLSGAVTLQPAKPAAHDARVRAAESRAGKPRGRMIAFGGREQTVSDWARELGIQVWTLRDRLERMPAERALTMPLGRYRTRGGAEREAAERSAMPLIEVRRGTCATCVEIRDDLQLTDGKFWECGSCRGDPAVTIDGPDRGYEPSGGLPSLTEVTQLQRAAFGAKRVDADSRRNAKPYVPPPQHIADTYHTGCKIEIADEQRRKLGGSR